MWRRRQAKKRAQDRSHAAESWAVLWKRRPETQPAARGGAPRRLHGQGRTSVGSRAWARGWRDPHHPVTPRSSPGSQAHPEFFAGPSGPLPRVHLHQPKRRPGPHRRGCAASISTREAFGVRRGPRREQRADRRPQPRRRRRSNVSLCSLRDSDPLENFSDEDVGLNRCQVAGDAGCIDTQTKHRPGVAGRLGLKHELSDLPPPPPVTSSGY